MSQHPTSRSRTFRALAIVVVFAASLGVVGRHAAGQSATAPEPPQVDGPVQYVGPDTYILLDAEGRPQPVLGMSYEEFVAAWKESQQLESRTVEPRFAIEELQVDGHTADDHAETEVKFTIRLLSDRPLRIPLGLAGAILRELPRWDVQRKGTTTATEPTRQPLVEYDAKLGGFVANLQGRPDERCTITLPTLIPLLRDGNETTLHLNCPRALVSKLALDVPMPVVDAAVSEGALLSRNETENDGTRLTVDGLAGDFQLTWSTADTQRTELATVLSATGAIAIAIDGHSIRSDARLTVGSYGGSFERFRVRLPPGAKLIQNRPGEATATPPAYQLTLENESSAAGPLDAQIVLIELAEKQAGPVEVALSTEQPLDLPGEELAVELAGFEVLGAVRQFGDVAVHVADDWQLRWQIGPHVRQVERTDLAPALEATQPTAAFQYDRQPWSLRARVAPRPLRVHVAPDYALEIDPNEARLQARLTYQVPGARAFEFRVQLNGWELTPDAIESNGLVDRDGVVVTRDGVLILPLAQASSRRAEIAFWVRRDVSRDAAAIELPLPAPEADLVAPAELTVSASPDMELVPDFSRARGISPTPISDDMPLPTVRAGRPVFRYRSFLPDAVFAAERTLRAADIATDVTTELKIDRRQIEATQTIDYAAQYQPLDRLVFDVPAGWSIVDGQVELLPTAANGADSAAPERLVVPIESELGVDDNEPHQVEIALPQPRLGRFGVRLRYHAAWPEELPTSGRVELPLPQPADTRIAAQRVRILGPRELSVSLDPAAEQSPWQMNPAAASANTPQAEVDLIATGPQPSLPLLLQPIARDLPQPTVVQRVWLQTWQAGGTIQDRAAFRFQTAGGIATVELPPLVPAEGVEVMVDGKLGDVAARERGRLVIDLPPAAGGADNSHTLELRYRRPAVLGIVKREVFTPPQLVGSSALHEAYWHVVLPGDLHVIGSPAQLVPVARWQWLHNFWGRQPTKSQAELEKWVGATDLSAPATAQCEYLYSGLAPVASIEIVTAPRWLIVFAASGAVLLAALLWMYIPAVRRPWVVLVAAVAVAALAVAYPTPAMLLAQASVLGWIAATIAVVLRSRLEVSAVRQPAASTGSTNLRFRPLSRPESMATPAPPTASGTPTVPLSTPEVDR